MYLLPNAKGSCDGPGHARPARALTAARRDCAEHESLGRGRGATTTKFPSAGAGRVAQLAARRRAAPRRRRPVPNQSAVALASACWGCSRAQSEGRSGRPSRWRRLTGRAAAPTQADRATARRKLQQHRLKYGRERRRVQLRKRRRAYRQPRIFSCCTEHRESCRFKRNTRFLRLLGTWATS